jgi:hypothetical protein
MVLKFVPMRGFLFLFVILSFCGCRRWFHKECRSAYAVNSGEIIYGLAYNCLTFNPDDKGDTFAITRSGQWDTLWAAIQTQYNGDCPKPQIDFNTQSVLAFYQTSGPNDKILRNVVFDHTAKQVIYTVTAFKCKNPLVEHLVLAISYNYVVVNKLPAGYKVVYRSQKEK